MRKIQIKEGDQYGKLTIVKEVEPHIEPSGIKRRRFECKCDCGNIIKVNLNSLRTNNTKTCGCIKKEIGFVLGKKSFTTHGFSKVKEYRTWSDMKQRCHNPKNKRYNDWGGRGIKVCERWKNSFENFLDDMGKKPGKEYSIDRINNDGNYEPSNCRWSTSKEQINNQRKKIIKDVYSSY